MRKKFRIVDNFFVQIYKNPVLAGVLENIKKTCEWFYSQVIFILFAGNHISFIKYRPVLRVRWVSSVVLPVVVWLTVSSFIPRMVSSSSPSL